MEKRIFPYKAGGIHDPVTVFADPLSTYRRIVTEVGGDLDGTLQMMQSLNPSQAIAATEKLLAATRAAFNLTPFNGMTGEGCCDEDVQALLERFTAWCEKKNPSAETSPTSPPASDSPGCVATGPALTFP